MNVMEIYSFVAMLFIIRRHVDTNMGPGCPSTFTTDACHADALIRQDICMKLRHCQTARHFVGLCSQQCQRPTGLHKCVCMLGAKESLQSQSSAYQTVCHMSDILC